ncbi:macro domain-containing protein [Zooshikella harenae]|uniref:Macro domain-containing protein n=1 Tax=Zooshikella harenae TaxID=2827238 RepID=A0ABS5ZJ19_9GAMM|nr:macro domain-containing protein [Zooshikella harenae]MBU2712992.1 macro domain-containing protein [Zooshikella harenae]
MEYTIVYGDILEQNVEVIVNSWNRNIIPWWLLLPQGVSGAIKKKGGCQPFKEVAKFGAITLGEARVTSAGKLPFKAIIHVAGINMLRFATKYSVTQSVKNVMEIVNKKNYSSVVFPLIGAGSGNRSEEWSLNIMKGELDKVESKAKVIVVRYSAR